MWGTYYTSQVTGYGRKKFDSFAIEFVKSDFDHPATTREESKV